MTYYKRELTPLLLDALDNMPVVVITGMRQVGKSTLIQKQPELKNRRYLNLGDFAQLEAAKHNPESFLKGETVTIDEVQRCPELFLTIKQLVDKDRKTGRFLLSGSANILLLKNVTESLAGRAIYLTLHPFSQREITQTTDLKPFFVKFMRSLELPTKKEKIGVVTPQEIMLGGMPTVCLKDIKNPALWFKGFEQTYLERDLRELSQVADLIAFRHLLQLAALRTGQILKVSELARDAKLSVATASRYLNLMEVSFIFQRLFPYLNKPSSRLIKSPKLYLSDSGLCCYLSGINNFDADYGEPLRGAIFENYVAQHLFAIVEAHIPNAKVFFWNIQGRHEVDFIVESGKEVVAIEVKAASRWNDRDLSHLQTFLSLTPHCKAAILAYNGTETVKLGNRLWAIPTRMLLS